MKDETKIKKRGIGWGFIAGLVILSMIIYMTFPTPEVIIDDGEWHIIFDSRTASAAENNAGSSGWLSTFLLDYTEDPDKMANGTWYESAANVSGYVSNDGGQDEVKSESGSYIVVRVKFNKDQCWDGSQFVHTRTKCHLTMTGAMDDETITNYPGTHSLYTRSSDANSTTGTNLYINFYWDDGVDGYKVPDDGRMSWNITVYAKY